MFRGVTYKYSTILRRVRDTPNVRSTQRGRRLMTPLDQDWYPRAKPIYQEGVSKGMQKEAGDCSGCLDSHFMRGTEKCLWSASSGNVPLVVTDSSHSVSSGHFLTDYVYCWRYLVVNMTMTVRGL